MAFRSLLIASLLGIAPLCAQSGPEALFRAIRANDLKTLRALPKNGADVTSVDRLKNTPLHYAAIYGSAESVQILLADGADPNARNSQDATPLILAAYDLTKTRLMVNARATVNIATHSGRTPLMTAASAASNAATVQYLIDKGADVNAVDGQGDDALMSAASFADEETVRTLLVHGADARRKDKVALTALLNAFQRCDDSRVALLLGAGADVNAANTSGPSVKAGPLALVQLTPLILAPSVAPLTVDALLKAGAHVNDRDIRKMTPLVTAVAADRADPALVKKLIEAGVDVNALDTNGETALDWALKYRNPEIVGFIRSAGGRESPSPQYPARPGDYKPASASEAVSKASALMVQAGQGFFAGSGCVGCHHQPMAARVYGVAQKAGLASDARLRQLLLDGQVAQRPFYQAVLPLLLDTGGDIDPALYQLTALADLGEGPSVDSDLLLHKVASAQQPAGYWASSGGRSPMSEGNILLTGMALRALKTYGWEARKKEFDERAELAKKWLITAQPFTNHERAERLMGLYYGGADRKMVRRAANDLLSFQRKDGGWSQNQWLDSDAYATGIALRALFATGSLKVSQPAYKRGADYLLSTQFPDGSWYVRSRSPKFQPYFPTGFPFSHDQWISSSATGWAVMALIPVAAAEKKPVMRSGH